MEGPAQTTTYMLAGYGVIFGVLVIYLISLWIRHRNLKRDEAMLGDLEQQQSE